MGLVKSNCPLGARGQVDRMEPRPPPPFLGGGHNRSPWCQSETLGTKPLCFLGLRAVRVTWYGAAMNDTEFLYLLDTWMSGEIPPHLDWGDALGDTVYQEARERGFISAETAHRHYFPQGGCDDQEVATSPVDPETNYPPLVDLASDPAYQAGYAQGLEAARNGALRQHPHCDIIECQAAAQWLVLRERRENGDGTMAGSVPRDDALYACVDHVGACLHYAPSVKDPEQIYWTVVPVRHGNVTVQRCDDCYIVRTDPICVVHEMCYARVDVS